MAVDATPEGETGAAANGRVSPSPRPSEKLSERTPRDGGGGSGASPRPGLRGGVAPGRRSHDVSRGLQTASKALNRRQFITGVMRTACGVGLLGLGLGLYSRRATSLPAWAIRPPGAIAEEDFNGACIRCGLCVRDCPFEMLHLAELGDEIPTGTPYFVARQAGCEMCEDIPCVKACPTNALDHGLTEIREADMGLAVLIDQENCIAFQGLRCEVCFNICPIRNEAITLDLQHNARSGRHARFIPIVHSDHCTGCGKCEEACILEEAAIKVLPRHLAQGKLGEHYRLGWKQKQRAGEALVTPDREHRYNLPEGMRYDHGGQGLIEEGASAGPGSPFPENPLDSLNRKGPL